MNGGQDETDGMVRQANPHLKLDSANDTLFHLGISTDQELHKKFGDIKVCGSIHGCHLM